MSSKIKRVVIVAPKSSGGNFNPVVMPRQGPLYISGALAQWKGPFLYEREIWYEDRSGKIDPAKDLQGVDILMVTSLTNEALRAYDIARKARELYHEIITIGGGPHMSPLADEALREGRFDVIVNREGEDVIGQLCDLLLTCNRNKRIGNLYKIPGISFLDDGHVAQTPRIGSIDPGFVELPDFISIRGLTPQNPMPMGIMETSRGCVDRCIYCQVVRHFLGYRMVSREVELKRLAQLQKMAEDGLIYTAPDGRFMVFVSDDLHPPPLKAEKYRNERLERVRSWKGRTQNTWLFCQSRAEIGQDPEMASALQAANFKMLYIGVETSSAENLQAVGKHQDPSQVNKDLAKLNELGFIICAMTMIGMPFDTEASVMDMAQWVKTVSKFQTANLIGPLPATELWQTWKPLDEDGSLLPEGKMRPYPIYTGERFVHYDERWTMAESYELYKRYCAQLNLVDGFIERIMRPYKKAIANQQLKTA